MFSIRRNHKQSGFTLMELLIVIAVLGLLIGMLIPRLGGVTDDTVDTVCDSNNKGIRYYTQMFYNTTGAMPDGLTNLVVHGSYATDLSGTTGAFGAFTRATGAAILPSAENDATAAAGAEVLADEFWTRNEPMIYTLNADEVAELAEMGITTVYHLEGPNNTMERADVAANMGVMMMGVGNSAFHADMVAATATVGNPEWLGRIMMAVNDKCDLVSRGMIQASALCPGAVLAEESFEFKHYVLVLPRLQATVDKLTDETGGIENLAADEEIVFTESNAAGASVAGGAQIIFNFSAQEPWQFDMSCPEGHKWPDNDQDHFVHTSGLTS